VDETDSEVCPMVGLGISSAEPLDVIPDS